MVSIETAASRPAPRRRRFAVSAVVGGSVVASLGMAEFALRMLDLPPTASTFGFLGGILGDDASYAADRERFWKLRPTPPWANELGLRGHLPAVRAPDARALRIACVGDSCTFGAHVRYEESYPMVLERLLREALPGRAVETIVAGVPGYTSWQDRVLFENHVVDFAPDLTVVYCGGWNDFAPALGESDRERAVGWRLLRLLRGAGAEPGEAEREERWREFRAGRARDGRRVPLPEFEDNVRAMVAAARGCGGDVVFVVPPLDDETFAETPIAADYRAAVRRIAADVGAPAFDAPAAFATERAVVAPPAGWPSTWPCLYDWVHPSPLGHRLIGEGLFAIVQAQGWLSEADSSPAPMSAVAAPRVDAVEQEGSRITLRGGGFATDGIERLFAGPWWLPDPDVSDDNTAHVRLPPGLPPGRYPLTLVGRFGARLAGVEIEIAPPPLGADVVRGDDGALHVTLRGEGPAGWRVHVWLATARAAEAEATRHGEFWLAGADDARPPGRPRAPFLFERLKIDPIDGEFAADGTWSHEIDVDAATAATLPAVLYLQGIVFEPPSTGRAALTGLGELRVSR